MLFFLWGPIGSHLRTGAINRQRFYWMQSHRNHQNTRPNFTHQVLNKSPHNLSFHEKLNTSTRPFGRFSSTAGTEALILDCTRSSSPSLSPITAHSPVQRAQGGVQVLGHTWEGRGGQRCDELSITLVSDILSPRPLWPALNPDLPRWSPGLP